MEGRLSPAAALVRIILETDTSADFDAFLSGPTRPVAESAPAAERLNTLSDLARQNADSWNAVRAAAAAVPHDLAPLDDPRPEVARLAAAFDRAAKSSPEASVALYSFGKADRLDAATEEVVAWLEVRGATGAERDVLDIGCGIGRLECALHQKVRSIVGIDISPEMVRIARERCAEQRNVRIQLTSGMDLAQFPNAAFDCTVALDAFPYLQMASDLAERHVAEASRVLRPNGDLVILNFSYRDSVEMDLAELLRFADRYGFRIRTNGIRPFREWDGVAFHLSRFD
ncbi:class I SAM-dependent methyltransferase [Mesorhizobium sp. BAC0120]|uniref:class I SAM-dependent methyltransferase n=1 Tax=Mesorhizobium sp. BAC0120 TaxID=3090670 RepID=UPI00298C0F0D|nr:class I SAM-dependent methyltransferase [Mesorhizobium sp. BAC0120]MDW6023576.1 class I SAM-dependent methyltransferase [Mesorhizobium sp. BAC0120]